MVERKPLSKKIRFEVFKRDSFTCQYCGCKAPDVILEVDHLNPVSKGGKNDMLNLITSCFDCNRGKKAVKLDDNSILEKQRNQIEELNLRRQQLEMILMWRDGLDDLENKSHQRAIDSFNSYLENSSLTEYGEKKLKSFVKKFGLINVLDAIKISFEKYSEDNLNKIGAILTYDTLPEHKKKMSYIKGILRNKFGYVKEPFISIKLNQYYENGFDLDILKSCLIENNFDSVSEVINWMEE